MKESYYQRNKTNWKKGGKYYQYKPKVSEGFLIVKKGNFIVYFD